MTFRELAFQEDLKLASVLQNHEKPQNPLKSLMENQSPIMKVWFVIMLVNLGLFLVVVQ